MSSEVFDVFYAERGNCPSFSSVIPKPAAFRRRLSFWLAEQFASQTSELLVNAVSGCAFDSDGIEVGRDAVRYGAISASKLPCDIGNAW